jgi:membrane protein required for colicin V production
MLPETESTFGKFGLSAEAFDKPSSYMEQMNVLDIVALLILILSILTALVKGLIIELLALASVVGGFVLAVFFYPELSSLLATLEFAVPLVYNFLAFLLIFVITIIVGSILSSCINQVLKKLRIKWIDRLLGGIFGFLRGYLINSVIFLALIAFPVNKGLLLESKLAEFFLAGVRILVIFVPEDLHLKFIETYEWLS